MLQLAEVLGLSSGSSQGTAGSAAARFQVGWEEGAAWWWIILEALGYACQAKIVCIRAWQ